MWLRDSANQMQSYLPLLKPSSSPNSLASLYRGVINLQARYLLTSPYCNSFQPPVESQIPPSANSAARNDIVKPTYNNQSVFECKYELDSLAAFLEISTNYYQATRDTAFFGKHQWVNAIKAVLSVAEAMMTPTYAANGSVNNSPYTFTRLTNRATETLANDGIGNPVQGGTSLIRSAFRPSDDATICSSIPILIFPRHTLTFLTLDQFLIPANLMFANYLAAASNIMSQIANQKPLAKRMSSLASSLQKAISTHGTFVHPTHGRIYAYEVDGYGSINAMDDANIPSLLSSPISGGIKASDSTYQATRRVLLSADNPYFMRGPVINSIGGPHNGPGLAWPMASIVRILTSSSEGEIVSTLKEIVSSTDGLGLIHESVNSFDPTKWTRQWFSWANGLFGQMVLDLEGRMPEVLGRSYQ